MSRHAIRYCRLMPLALLAIRCEQLPIAAAAGYMLISAMLHIASRRGHVSRLSRCRLRHAAMFAYAMIIDARCQPLDAYALLPDAALLPTDVDAIMLFSPLDAA